MSLRKSVKTAISNVVKSATGVNSVSLFRPKINVQTEMPLVVISLPKAKERRLTQSAPVGKKLIDYTAQLEVFLFDVTEDGSGALDFDDLLDAIDDKLRLDPTLGGAVLASTIEFITTSVAAPTLVNGQTVALLAIKQFDVTVQVTG